MATVQDRTHDVNGLNDPQQGACSGPEAPAYAPCSAGGDADVGDWEICQASNGKENTMRAVTVTEYGATPAVAEMPTPEPGPGQVLIRLRAVGMNPMDRALACGAWKPMPATFPMVLGVDGAGVVEQLGPGASRFSIGDDLFGQLLIAPLGSAGTYAEYVAVTEDAPLARVPGGLHDVVAAALPPAGGAGPALVDLLEPLSDKTRPILGSGGARG